MSNMPKDIASHCHIEMKRCTRGIDSLDRFLFVGMQAWKVSGLGQRLDGSHYALEMEISWSLADEYSSLFLLSDYRFIDAITIDSQRFVHQEGTDHFVTDSSDEQFVLKSIQVAKRKYIPTGKEETYLQIDRFIREREELIRIT